MRIYHGWYVVFGAVMAAMLVSGLVAGAFGVFVIPISEDLGISRADMNSALMITSFGNAFFAPIIGRMVDKYSNRIILGLSGICVAIALAVLGASPWLWLNLIMLGVLLPIGIDGTTSITMSNLVARWFHNYRARAMAIAAMGLSLGGAVLAPVTALLISWYGWRGALMVLAATIAIVMLAFAFTLRERPGPEDIEPGTQPDRTERNQQSPKGPMPMGELLRSPKLWMIMLATSIVFGVSSSTMISLVPLAVGHGITLLEATGLVTISAIAGMVAKVFLAWYGDRANRAALMALTCLLVAIMFALFWVSRNYWVVVAASAMLGIGYGVMLPLMQTMVADIFGAASYGTVRGLFGPINAVFNAAGARFSGEVYDRTGSYQLMFVTFFVLAVVAVLVTLPLLRNNAKPSHHMLGSHT